MSRDSKASDVSVPGVPASVCKVYSQAAGTFKAPEEWRGAWVTFLAAGAVVRFGDAAVVVTPGAQSAEASGVLTEDVETGVTIDGRFDFRLPLRANPDDDIWFAISDAWTAYRSSNP